MADLPTYAYGLLRTWVPIIDARPGWALVLLPCLPDGSVGWVRLDDRVVIVAQPTHIEIHTRRRTVALVNGPERRVWPAGVGRPASPTPRGRTFVLGSVDIADGLVDRAILLAAHMPTHLLHGTGLPAVGIHAWPGTVFGLAGSDGCVLVPDLALTDLEDAAPPGTTVLIH
ncbi:L,D-transpeptidase [Alloactinosynnema sp. L-07]|uniref:L,D-transpeptidase n=1 Tax=Alloactinosynnema sp. L-07 TaxID=1653480 RepID=UPI001561460B|nr:L,D-transpeptidase [Alloactinosynnema sp. L-07]